MGVGKSEKQKSKYKEMKVSIIPICHLACKYTEISPIIHWGWHWHVGLQRHRGAILTTWKATRLWLKNSNLCSDSNRLPWRDERVEQERILSTYPNCIWPNKVLPILLHVLYLYSRWAFYSWYVNWNSVFFTPVEKKTLIVYSSLNLQISNYSSIGIFCFLFFFIFFFVFQDDFN